MIFLRVFFLLNLLAVLISQSLLAQNYVFDAEQINVENGLPNRSTFYITQDKQGYIWTSMPGAISKYDGYKFKTYNNSKLNTTHYAPLYIAIDKHNNLWFCEQELLSRPIHSGIINAINDSIYDVNKYTNNFFKNDKIVSLYQSKKDKHAIFIITRNGSIYKYKDNYQKIYEFPTPLDQKINVYEGNDDDFFLVYRNEILRVKDNEIKERHIVPTPNNVVLKIVSTKPNGLIAEARNLGVRTYWILNDDSFLPYTLPGKHDYDQVFQITQDYILFSKGHTILACNNKGDILFEFSDVSTSELEFKYQNTFLDDQNILWITSGNGLYKIIAKKSPFKILQENQSIRGIYKEKDTLYIGSYTENVKIHLETYEKKAFLKNKAIAATAYSKDNFGSLWVGTTSANLYRFLPEHNIGKVYKPNNRKEMLIPWYDDKTDKLWIGTSDGVSYFNAQNQTIEPLSVDLPKNTTVRYIYSNNQGIWLLTTNGMFLINTNSGELLKHVSKKQGLPYLNTMHLHEDPDGSFWIATQGGGLVHWKRSSNTFTSYTTDHGLSNNTIYAVYPDNYNNLWLPSNYGLMRFNKETKNVQVYLPENGIAHEEFNTYAHFIDSNGTLYFGGLNGVTYFHPENLANNNYVKVPLNINSVKVLNDNEVDFKNITSQYLSANTIQLYPTDRILEVEVSLMDFEDSNIQYKYKIEGYQEQWFHTTSNRVIINNLPYGTYTLKIGGIGYSSNTTSDVLEIPIKVNKPWYLTAGFIVAMLALFILLVYMYLKRRFAKLEKAKEHLEQQVNERTKQIEADKQIIASQAENLKQLDELKSRFFTNITHEFRTPLTLIKGPLEQIIDNPPPPNIFKRRIQGILKNTNHILNLINQLLDLSKLEKGEMKLEVVYADIVQHTEELVNRFALLAQKKHQKLSFISSKKSWNTYFDQEKWDKILFNLISNAIKFTPGHEYIQINLYSQTSDEKEHIVLAVKDSGIGINEEDQKLIFNRFHQLDNTLTRGYEGTGVGLALVKELVDIQNGKINLSSKKDEGSTFIIQLPILSDYKTKAPKKIFNSQDIIPALNSMNTNDFNEEQHNHDSDRLDLLIVEDNEEMRDYIKQCLNSSEYNIIESSNGKEGLQTAQSVIPDLIISDIMMPIMDGYEFARLIRKNINTSHIPLILLTAKTTTESKLKGLSRGADAYLTKPFSPKELELRIEKLIEIRRLIQQRYNNSEVWQKSKTYHKEDKFMVKLNQFIIDNLDTTTLNGDIIGKHFAISRVHLHRKLKALTDLSISEYIKKIRLKEAMKLIKQKELNVSEIAYKTGFSSPGHFSKSFKKAFGKTPSQM